MKTHTQNTHREMFSGKGGAKKTLSQMLERREKKMKHKRQWNIFFLFLFSFSMRVFAVPIHSLSHRRRNRNFSRDTHALHNGHLYWMFNIDRCVFGIPPLLKLRVFCDTHTHTHAQCPCECVLCRLLLYSTHLDMCAV